MKKRVLALLMVMALCLSLAPLVMADGPSGGTSQSGLYANYANGSVSNYLKGYSAITVNNNTVYAISVDYESGIARNCYFFDPDADFSQGLTLGGNNYVHATVRPVNPRVLHIAIDAQCSGKGTVNVSYQGRGFPLVFSDGSDNDAAKNNQGGQGGSSPSFYMVDPDTSTTYSKNGDGVLIAPRGKTLELRAEGWTFTQLQAQLAWDTITVGNGADTSCLLVYCTAGDTNINNAYFRYSFDSTQHTVTVTGEHGNNHQMICFTASGSGNSQGGNGQGGNQRVYRTVQPTGKAVDIPYAVVSDADIAPIPFIYKGQEYCIGVAEDDDYLNPMMNKGNSLFEGQSISSRQCVCFWTRVQTSVDYRSGLPVYTYTPIAPGSALSNELLGQFSGLRLELQRSKSDVQSAKGWTLSSPEVRYLEAGNDVDPTHLELGITYNTPGHWVAKLSGTLAENSIVQGLPQDIAAYGMIQISQGVIVQPDPGVTFNTLADVSAWLAAEVAANNADMMDPSATIRIECTIPYRDTGYSGILEIPAVKKDLCLFYITGAEGPNHAKPVIRGGVNAQGGKTTLTNIYFVADDAYALGPDSFSDTPYTVCGYGAGEILGNSCVFYGYDYAMRCTGEENFKWGFTNCTFSNNRVAIYMNSTHRVDGGCRMFGNTFEHNGIALEVAGFSPIYGIHIYVVANCKFLYNRCDVKNTSGRDFYIPKNYFEHFEADPNDSSRLVVVHHIKCCPDSNAATSDYPVALDPSFTAFDYSDRSPIVSVNFTYEVPKAVLVSALEIADGQVTFSLRGEEMDREQNILVSIPVAYWLFHRNNA